MTIQFSEELLYNGQSYSMHSCPLEVYFNLGGKRVPFLILITMCWRGYVGTWVIDGGELRLVALRGYIAEEPLLDIAKSAFRHVIDTEDRSLCREAVIDAVFPGYQGPIFAHWYSGLIEAENPEDRTNVLLVDVKRGIVKNIRFVEKRDEQT